jgi:CheY-like chemotaxis protein
MGDQGGTQPKVVKLLIAEDNQDQQELIRNLTDFWGFECDIAANGQAAVELAKVNEGKYDLCLMDIDMPVMNGLEATKSIRQEVKYFPIMALTGNPTEADAFIDAGMDDYLQKPYDPNMLYDKIHELNVKAIKVRQERREIILSEEKPMNPEELKELVELKKKGLTKLRILGVGHTFIVHRNIQNKISYDLVGEGKELSEFLDRSDKEPGRCHLYKMNLHVTKDLFTPDELEDAIRREDEIAVRFNRSIDKKLPE